MANVGEILREARQEKAISLREAEEATKIRLKYLEALENGEYDQIPGRVYAQGFLRNYAKYLGLNVSELINQFKEEYPPEEEKIIEELTTSVPAPSLKKSKILFIILGVFLILWSMNWLYNHYKPLEQTPLQSSVNEQTTRPQSQITTPPPASEIGEIEGLEIELKLDGRCWTNVVIDGKDNFSGILNAGESKVFKGDNEIYVKLGNAGAAKIIVNGKVQPSLGDYGEIFEKTFKASDYNN
ncbi:MAG: hypothetical protein PWP31_507 [Clostridia bacterium]|nr:hypothetical protein [Clostridia bacterium]